MKLLVGLLLLMSGTAHAVEQQALSFIDKIEGKWSIHKPGEDLCNDIKFLHTIKVSEDRKHLLFLKHKEAKDVGVLESIYKIIYTGENYAMIFLDGETRELPMGDLVIWQLLLEDDQYRWRIYAMPTEWRNNVIGVRC